MSKTISSPVKKPLVKAQVEASRPLRFKVFMHNDDYTTMEFVVQVLEVVFHKPATEAYQIMLNIHFKGVGLCGAYPFDIAETKVDRVHCLAHEAGFPLRCSLEEE